MQSSRESSDSWYALVNDHPGRSKLIAQHREAVGKKCLLHRHEGLTTIGKQSKDAFGFADVVQRKRKIHAAHRLKTFRGHVTSHQVGLADVHSGIQDGTFLTGRYILCIRLLSMGHHHCDLSAEMPFIEEEGLRAIAAVVEIGM